MDRGAWWATVHGVKKAGHDRRDLAAADPTWQRWKEDRNYLNISQFHWNG